MATTKKKTIPLKPTPKKKEPTPPPTYDPSKNYVWKPEDKFTFTGEEYALLYNGLAPLARLLAPAMGAFQVLQKKFEQEVTTKKIKEAPKETPAA